MPFVVENNSPFPHFAFLKTGPDGSVFQVLAVRGTFSWVHDGEMTIAATQEPVVVADRVDGPPGKGELRVETDLVVGKPRADVHVLGHAHAPRGELASDWPVSVSIGDLSRALRVTGPRFWQKDALGFRLSPAQPVADVPLSYRIAYGGTRRRATSSGEEEDTFEPNPIGVGYKGRFPIEEALWSAPQIEAIDAPIRSISDQPAPEGLGPIARWWAPRRARSGTLTEAFVRENPGKLPDDFDWAYYNSAHPSLIYSGFLKGDEHVGTVGLFPEGRSGSRLPGYCPVAILVLRNGLPFSVEPKLDTLTIDTDARQVYATWRVTVPEKLGMRTLVLGFAVPRPTRTTHEALFPLRTRA